MKNYKALILEDDIENSNLLSVYLSKYCKNITVVAKTSTVNEGVEKYYKHLPDILFLDIKLENNETSFNLIDKLKNLNSEIIFISNHNDYALKAISINVVGYIIKPIEINELVNVVSKAVKNIENKFILKQNQSNKFSTNILAIPYQSKIELVRIPDIVYLEADSRYTIFHLANGGHKIASKNLGRYEEQLTDFPFFRIHHRFIVNLDMVKNINKSGGNYCELVNNKALPIAKRRFDELNKFLSLK